MKTRAKVEAEAPPLKGILQAVESSADPDRAPALKSFAREILSGAPADFLAARSESELSHLVCSMFADLEATPRGSFSVRVYQRPDHGRLGSAEVIISDRPFVVDSVRQYLVSRGFEIRHQLHPVVVVGRDNGGAIAEIRDWRTKGERTSVVYCEFEGPLDDKVIRDLEEDLKGCVEDVRLATDDFERMLEKTRELSSSLREHAARYPDLAAVVDEIIAFMAWLRDAGFVFLGYRAYDYSREPDGRMVASVRRGSGLGILRREEESKVWEPTSFEEVPAEIRERALHGPLLLVSKANSESRVHRRARMDYIGLKMLDEAGKVVGEHRFLGLFTWKAYSEAAGTIPILRKKLESVLASSDLPEESHDYKAIIALFNDMPLEELFQVDVDDLGEQIAAVIAAEDTGDVHLVVTPDMLGRGVNVMVILPKRNYSDEVRGRLLAEIAETIGGGVLNDHLSIGEGDAARLHLYISATPQKVESLDLEELRKLVGSVVRTWKQRLRDALGNQHGLDEVHQLTETYFEGFAPEYVAKVDVDTAARDIERLEELERTGVLQVALADYRNGELEASELRLFATRGSMILADAMPMLEDLGLRVIEAHATEVAASGKGAATIHTFVVQGPDSRKLDAGQVGSRLAETLRAVSLGLTDSDQFNHLAITAGLNWSEVAVLRAYSAYGFQIGAVTSRRAAPDALTSHPQVARLLFEVFRVKFDPRFEGDRSYALQEASTEFRESLHAVEGITDDLNLRRLHNLIEATVRTSYFRSELQGLPSPRATFKLNCQVIQQMPQPRPAREVFVHSPRTAGLHLRFGPVARGGIRWSERPDDFRTEVLGLVKTQQVKNAVIVPTGAKGAFYVRKPPSDRTQMEPAIREGYREYISGLLDVTDNIVDGKVVHPPDTVVYDDEDYYLVVAADKGTAAYSDIANEVAEEYGFWMGDAFASGGSHGYDHKKLAITARGVWESVRRHFREIGKDIRSEPVRVIGIGDMSGDVFGNGMLLSRTIRLVAAFDNRHILIDPDPDPEASYEERRRLFDLPGSSWRDYDPAFLSPGGGVYPRGSKEIHLSPAAQELLGIAEAVVNGQALIRAILRMPAELMWNGGIGTYVKASIETNAGVSDPGNDAVRVNADELRARVIGEGGNLGLTQLARIEHALGGGHVNTDAVDNSGGVDMSDHEVNIKILLQTLVDKGQLTLEERNLLLADVSEEVAESVLANNRNHSRGLSLEAARAVDRLSEFRDALYYLERLAGLNRSLEFLPGWEHLRSRQEQGKGLTRPELALMLAYSKLYLKNEILDSSLPDDPALVQLLKSYFPSAIIDRVAEGDLRSHPLAREIIATVLTNKLVDLMGCPFVPQISRDTGAPPARVARGWYVATEIAGANELLARIHQSEDQLPATEEYRWLLALESVLDRTVRWAVENLPDDAGIGAVVEKFKEPVARLCDILPDILMGSQQAGFEELFAELKVGGAPPEAAQRIAALRFLGELMEVTRISRDLDADVSDIGRIYFALADEIDFAWLIELLTMAPGEDVWEQRAAQGLMQDLGQARRNMTLAVLAIDGEAKAMSIEKRLGLFRSRHEVRLGAMRDILEELLMAGDINLAALTVATREVVRQSITLLDGRPS